MIEKINKFFGVMPPNTIRRLTIATIAIAIVLLIDIIALLGNLGILKLPYLTEKIVNVLIVSSVLFSISLIYYIILPGKEKKRAEAYAVLR